MCLVITKFANVIAALWTSNVQDMFAERIMRQVENGSGELVGQNMSQVLAVLLQKEEILNTVKG